MLPRKGGNFCGVAIGIEQICIFAGKLSRPSKMTETERERARARSTPKIVENLSETEQAFAVESESLNQQVAMFGNCMHVQ